MMGSPSGAIGRRPAHGGPSPGGLSQPVNAWAAAFLMAATRRGLIVSSSAPNSIVPARRRQQPDQGGENRPAGPVQPGPRMYAAQHGDLVAQHEQLDVLGKRV